MKAKKNDLGEKLLQGAAFSLDFKDPWKDDERFISLKSLKGPISWRGVDAAIEFIAFCRSYAAAADLTAAGMNVQPGKAIKRKTCKHMTRKKR